MLVFAGVGGLCMIGGGEFLNYSALQIPGVADSARRSLGIVLTQIGVGLDCAVTALSIVFSLGLVDRPRQGDAMVEVLADVRSRPNFVAFVALFLCGLYIAIAHHNLVKKVIGLYIDPDERAVLPRQLRRQAGRHGADPARRGPVTVDARAYVNPLPHALTLTGIVVGVATLGVVALGRRRDLPARTGAWMKKRS